MKINRGQRPELQWVEVVYGRMVAHGPAVLVAAAMVLLSGRLFRLISRYAVNIFFWDEWDLKTVTLFQKNSFWEMFNWQHGWHRLGLGAWVEKAVDSPLHWNSRSESFVLGVIIACAAICALWLKVRIDGKLSIFDVLIPAIFFSPAQWETLYMTPIYSQGPLPFLLVMFYGLAFTCERNTLRYPLVLAINFVTIYTGFGIFLGVLTPVLLSLDFWAQVPAKRLPRTYFVVILLLSLGSLGLFFRGYIPTAGIGCYSQFQQSSLESYVGFLALIIANFFALTGHGFYPLAVGLTIFVAILISLVCAIGWLLRRGQNDVSRPEHTRQVVVAALTAVSLASCMVIAYVRLCAGLQAAEAPRYTVYVQIGVLGLYFQLIGVRGGWVRRLLMTVLMITASIACFHSNRQAMVRVRDGKQRWKMCYLQIENIEQCNQNAGFLIYPLPGENRRLDEKRQRLSLPQKLEYLKKTRQNLYLDAKRH
jgi:hypothetical protein